MAGSDAVSKRNEHFYENGSSTMKLSRHLGGGSPGPAYFNEKQKKEDKLTSNMQPVHPSLANSPYFREKILARSNFDAP